MHIVEALFGSMADAATGVLLGTMFVAPIRGLRLWQVFLVVLQDGQGKLSTYQIATRTGVHEKTILSRDHCGAMMLGDRSDGADSIIPCREMVAIATRSTGLALRSGGTTVSLLWSSSAIPSVATASRLNGRPRTGNTRRQEVPHE